MLYHLRRLLLSILCKRVFGINLLTVKTETISVKRKKKLRFKPDH